MDSALFTYQERESTIDFPGRISLLFFTKGCNFRCGYCHNPELIPRGGENLTYGELEEILRRAMNNWVDGVSISGGEPTLQKELPETLRFIKDRGFDIKLDTQGSLPHALKKALPFCDYIAMDYKMPIERYSTVAGVPVNGDAVRESLNLLQGSGVPFEIRTTIVPGIHKESDILDICSELQGVETFVLQKFIPRDNLPGEDMRTLPPTDAALMNKYGQIARKFFPRVILR